MTTKKPTAPQARFLAAIHKAGGVSKYAMHEVTGYGPINRCIAAGWAEQLPLPGGHAGQVMHAITPAGCEVLGLDVLPVMPDCANCIGLGHVFGGQGINLRERYDLDESRNQCVWCKGTGKGTAAADNLAAMRAAVDAIDARWQEDLAAAADGCPECGEHHQAGIDCRTPAHSVDLTVTAPDEPVDPAAEEAAAGHWPTGDEVDEALTAWEAERRVTRAYAQHAAQVAAGNPACQDRTCAHLDVPATAAPAPAELAGFVEIVTPYGPQLAMFANPTSTRPIEQLGLFDIA